MNTNILGIILENIKPDLKVYMKCICVSKYFFTEIYSKWRTLVFIKDEFIVNNNLCKICNQKKI